jgi:hypothetical protein
LHRLHKRFFGPQLILDFARVIERIDQSRVNIRQGQVGIVLDDFFRTFSLLLMPDVNILNPNSGSADTWFAAADTRFSFDAFHKGILPGFAGKEQLLSRNYLFNPLLQSRAIPSMTPLSKPTPKSTIELGTREQFP